MLVKVLSFSRSAKPAVLASVRLELALDGGDSIIVDDARVLRNKHGQLWLAMPSYSVPANGGRSYDYLPAVILSTLENLALAVRSEPCPLEIVQALQQCLWTHRVLGPVGAGAGRATRSPVRVSV